ncbi:MAG: hypothetical protein IJ325_13900 [Clostridia bacterium]|nr:hypothetical protein [Clostridia bacterium]
MAKICRQCGVKYKNSATKCIMCGTEFNDVHIYAKKKKHLILGIVGTILAAVTVVMIIFSTGPEAAVWRIMESHKRNDVEEIVESFPDFLMESENFDEKAFMVDVKSVTGYFSKYIFSYNIGAAQKPSSRECAELMEVFRYYAGDAFDESQIEDIRMVWVNYKCNIPSFWPSRATRFIMIKYEGRWCWWPSNVNR